MDSKENIKSMNIETVIFDMYDTLIFQSEGYERTSEFIAEMFGFPYDAYKKARQSTYDNALLGKYKDALERVEMTLKVFMPNSTTSFSQEVLNAEITHRKQSLRIFPNAFSTLQRISQIGVKLGLLSNATPEWEIVFNSTKIESLFDIKIFSFNAHLTKPDPQIYKIALAKLNAKSGKTIYVGDGADNEFIGAKKAGLITAGIVRNENIELLDIQKYSIDYQINDLKDLLDIISEMRIDLKQR